MKINETYGARVVQLEDSIEIQADDGRTLYTIDLNKDGSLSIHANSVVRYNEGKLLDTGLQLTTRSPNWFIIKREDYEN